MENNAVDGLQNTNEPSPAKVLHDPGWNDPPPMSYSETKSVLGSTAKRGVLSKPKRVAFPIATSSQTCDKQDSGIQPETFTPPLIAMPPKAGNSYSSMSSKEVNNKLATEDVVNTNKSDEVEKTFNKEIAMEIVSKILEDATSNAFGGEKEKDVAEVLKRLAVMKAMWTDNKLDLVVQEKLFRLAKAVENGRGDVATDLNVALSVDHISQCSSWIAGIRKLVHRVATKSSEGKECDRDAGDNKLLTHEQQLLDL